MALQETMDYGKMDCGKDDSMIQSIVDKYRALMVVDQGVMACCSLLNRGYRFIHGLRNHSQPDNLGKRSSLVGSASEGAVVPRMFSSELQMIELDIMVKLAELERSNHREVLAPVTEKISFYKVFKDNLLNLLPPNIQEKHDNYMNDKTPVEPQDSSIYLSGVNLRRIVEKIIEYKDDGSDSQIMAAKVWGRTKNFKVDSTLEFHGPSVNAKFLPTFDHEVVFSFSVDLVLYIQINFWPEQAEPWIKRKRYWPHPDLVTMATHQGCQLVSKPQRLHHVTAEVDQEEWRLTFTKAENLLALNRTPEQQLVYLIAKSTFYGHLDIEMEGSRFSSYCLKTCMMWLLEETPAEEWTPENTITMVQKLFRRLEESVLEGILPYYFIPQVNLLEEYPTEMLTCLQVVLREINHDVFAWIPGHDKVEAVKEKANVSVSKLTKVMVHLAQVNIQEALEKERERKLEQEQKNVNKVNGHGYRDDDLD